MIYPTDFELQVHSVINKTHIPTLGSTRHIPRKHHPQPRAIRLARIPSKPLCLTRSTDPIRYPFPAPSSSYPTSATAHVISSRIDFAVLSSNQTSVQVTNSLDISGVSLFPIVQISREFVE